MSDPQRTERLQETQQALMNVMRLLLMLPQDAVDEVVDEVNHMDAIMPLVDPTGWMRIAKNIPNHRTAYQALASARRAIVEVMGKEQQRAMRVRLCCEVCDQPIALVGIGWEHIGAGRRDHVALIKDTTDEQSHA